MAPAQLLHRAAGVGFLQDADAAAIASLERQLIGERVLDGRAQAREKGKQLGPPPLPPENVAEIRRLLQRDISNYEKTTQLEVSEAEVRKYARRTPVQR